MCRKCYRKYKIETKPKILCQECNKLKILYLKNMCKTCYNRLSRQNSKNLGYCSICKKKRSLINNICKSCFEGKTKIVVCKYCKENLPLFAKNMCKKCYSKHWSNEKIKQKCILCDKITKNYRKMGKGYICIGCYNRSLPYIECSICFKKIQRPSKINENGPICYKCYNKIRGKAKCSICKEIKTIAINNKQMCYDCYFKEYNNKPEVIAKKNEYLYNRRNWYKLGGFSNKDWLYIMNEFEWKCFYCGSGLHRYNRTIDHIIPITKGGLHEKWNIVPCCVSCNSSKNNKLLMEWISGNKYIEILDKIKLYRPKTLEGKLND